MINHQLCGYFLNNPEFFLGRITGTEEFEIDESIPEEVGREIKQSYRDSNIQMARGEEGYSKGFRNLSVGDTGDVYVNRTAFKTEYCGINTEGLRYKFVNPKRINTGTQSYVYKGKVQFGKIVPGATLDNSGITTASVVVDLEDPIDIVFIENSFISYHELGKMFTEANAKKQRTNGISYLGKLAKDPERLYKFEESKTIDIPEHIKLMLEDDEQEVRRPSNVIDFNKRKEGR